MPASRSIVLLCIIVLLTGSSEAIAPWDHLPDNMEPFCPSKDICRRRNSSTEYPRLNIAKKYQQCCTDCSCDDDCGLTDSCCFPEMNLHPKPDRSLQECINPTTLNTGVNKIPGFYMNTRSSKRSMPSSTPTTSADCGDLNVAQVGDLFPVYSMVSGVIYKNPECAKEDGIDDFIFWTAVLQCGIFDKTNKRQFSISQFQIMSVLPPMCRILFVPPTEIVPLIEKDICYNDVIDTCDFEEKMKLMPDMENKEIIDACESGFFSPVLLGDVYANVFCFICNAESAFTVGGNLCETVSANDVGKTTAGIPALTTIININRNKEMAAAKDQPHRFACLKKQQTEKYCRRVLCSSGQSYNKQGNCDFLTEQWNGLRPKITLTLHPAVAMTTSELRKASEGRASLDSWIRFPWPSSWHVTTAFSEETLDSESTEREPTVTLAIVVVYERMVDLVPHVIFDEISESIRKDVEICTRDRCTMAKQAIADYAYYTTSGDQTMPDWQTVLLKRDVNKYPFDKKVSLGTSLLYFSRRFQDGSLNLGKTFLCDQIELQPTEFELFGNSVLMYYENLNLLFYDNEFDLLLQKNGNYTARVCMKDVGFTEYHTSGSYLSAVMPDWIPLALLVSVATFFP